MSEDKRSGSELLRDVESKLDSLERHIRNIDNNMKLVLSQFNQLMQALPQPAGTITYPPESVDKHGNVTLRAGNSGNLLHGKPVGDYEEKLGEGSEPKKTYKFEDLPKSNKFEQMQSRYGLVEEPRPEPPKPVGERIIARPQSDEAFDKYELVEESKKKGRARGQRVPEAKSNRVGVSQQILFPNGSPAFLASVEILNDKGVQVKQTRTNTKGHWVAPLAPGEYTVHVVKHVPPESDKQSFDIRYTVEIPPSDKKLELPPPEIGDEDA